VLIDIPLITMFAAESSTLTAARRAGTARPVPMWWAPF